MGIKIDVNFLILPDAIPTLLSVEYMIDNKLELSIQGRYLTYNGNRQPLQLTNYILIYNWYPHDQPYVLYTFEELKRIHTSFGHPSIRATRALLKRATGNSTSATT